MSPEPIIALQRRLTIAGAIRDGGEKPERGVGKKLEHWRITSAREELVRQAAALYGGQVSQWQAPEGVQWQVYTEADTLPVLVMPSYSLRQTYELWEGATKRTRSCDGVEEALSDGPCICNAEGVDRCDIYSRLVVVLPELDTVLGWRHITRGANAAHEMPTTVALAERVSGGATFVPMRLRIDHRRSVKDGQVVRFVVPVLDLAVGYLALGGAAERPALPAANGEPHFVPAARPEPTVEEALGAVAQPPARQSAGGRRAAAFGADPDDDFGAAPGVPGESGPAQEQTYTEERQTKGLTDPQARKLNTLVGKLRERGALKTAKLYNAVGRLRGVQGEELATGLGGFDAEGGLHWSPLRDSLTRPEAVKLIDWLEDVEQKTQPAPTTPQGPQDTFPDGY